MPNLTPIEDIIFSPGDLLKFSGSRWVSALISLGTYSWPYFGASHVAIVGRLRGDPVLFESTTLTDLPDLVTKDPIKGVQCHEIANRVASYNGRIWHYPLTKVLDFTKRRELGRCLWDHHGVAYDVLGALRSGGCLFSWLESLMRVEDLNSIFCSELVAAAYRAVGLLDTDNVSRWSPNRIIRHQIKRGVVAKQGVRLK